jgi:hypothetical protein
MFPIMQCPRLIAAAPAIPAGMKRQDIELPPVRHGRSLRKGGMIPV